MGTCKNRALRHLPSVPLLGTDGQEPPNLLSSTLAPSIFHCPRSLFVFLSSRCNYIPALPFSLPVDFHIFDSLVHLQYMPLSFDSKSTDHQHSVKRKEQAKELGQEQ